MDLSAAGHASFRAFKVQPPAGWRVARVELWAEGDDGSLAVAVCHLSGETLDDLAASHAKQQADTLPGYASEGLEHLETARGSVLSRRYSWQEPGGARREEVALLRIVGDAPYLAVLTAPEPATEEHVRAAAEALGALVPGGDFPVRRFSVEELATLAALCGEKSFPGTGELELDHVEQRDAALRSLFARGTILAIEPGERVHLEPMDAAIVTTALQPHTVLDVQHVRAEGVENMLFYIAPETSVAHRAGAHGVHRLEPMPTPLVGVALARFADLEDDGDGKGGEAITVPTDEYTRLRDAAASGRLEELQNGGPLGELLRQVASSTHVRIAPAAAGGATATEFQWLRCSDSGLWLIDPNTAVVTLAPLSVQDLGRRLGRLWPAHEGEDPNPS